MNSVMLVTADRELAKMVKEALRDTTARVSLVVSAYGEIADAYAKNPVSLVIADYFLPESSGLEVLKTVKRLNENCLFIFLARVRTRLVLERAFRMGAQDVLIYPVEPEMLRDTVLHRLQAEPLTDEEAPDPAGNPPART